jgi:hypothetical protein
VGVSRLKPAISTAPTAKCMAISATPAAPSASQVGPITETDSAVVPTNSRQRATPRRASRRRTHQAASPATSAAASTSTAPTWLVSVPFPTVSCTPSAVTSAQAARAASIPAPITSRP